MFAAIYNYFTQFTIEEQEEKEDDQKQEKEDEDYRTGLITYIALHSAEIDHSYVFPLKTDCFSINDKVRYKIKNNHGNIEIYDVTHDYTNKSGNIIKIDQNIIIIEGNYKFKIEQIDFTPLIGDYINIKYINNQTQIDVEKKSISGLITSYDHDLEQGLINDLIIFYKKNCSFEPIINTNVASIIIKHKNGYRSIDTKLIKNKIDIPKIPFFTLKHNDNKKIDINISNITNRLYKIDFELISNSVDIIQKQDEIKPNDNIIFIINCRANKIGKNEAILKWKFDQIKIIRYINYNVENNQIIIPGTKKQIIPNYINIKMKYYNLPQEIYEICSQGTKTAVKKLIDLYKFENNRLNYIDKMHNLLYIEESWIVLKNKLLTNIFPLYMGNNCVYIEYIIDSEYSNLGIGDIIYVCKPWDEFKYEGRIFDMNSHEIFIKLNNLFMDNFKSGALYKIDFVTNRTCMRKTHMAIDLIHKNNLYNRVFPSENIIDSNNLIVKNWFNCELNQEQKNAVTNILNQKTSHPYVIFGPPGTGKTITIVETILQLNQKNNKIMIVAPTNSAIDLIGCQLIKYGCTDMVRLSSYSAYKQGNVSSIMSDITFVPSLFDEYINSDVPIMTKNNLGQNKITLGTMQCIGTLCSLGINFFTHIIIDEAGQSTEPEILIPISFLNPKSKLILAGDPNQLGPIVKSQIAKELGLKESFLSRIVKLKYYNDSRIMTKLVKNYRALPQLVELISRVFYDNDLVSMLNETSRESMLLKKININNKPINKSMICVDVNGNEAQVKESSSYYNNAEVIKIVILLNELYNVITPDQIGIITPYSLQVKMIYKRLESLKIFSPKIGSVEEFQGAERDVIIFSTVRNSKDYNQLPDFITERNKINVALSRAKMLNIIVGNKNYLQTDTMWQEIINYCN